MTKLPGSSTVSVEWKAGNWTFEIGAARPASQVVYAADALVKEIHSHPLPASSAGVHATGHAAGGGHWWAANWSKFLILGWGK
ncbi:MAG: hypothetical protein ACRDX8_01195 [Acidimicrobiales bacterium]